MKKIFLHSTFLGKILRFPLKLIPAKAKVRVLTGLNKGFLWIVGSGVHSYWLGFFEKEIQDIFKSILKKGDIFFDIGAHVGFFSVLASRIIGNDGKVFAFEPYPRNICYLKEHININHLKNIQVYEDAVMDKVGEMYFQIDTDRAKAQGKVADSGDFKIKTVSLDSLYQEGKIPLPNSMKIDVEGGEVLVIKGAISILKEAKPIIILSTHGEEVHKKSLTLLKELGYSFKSLNPNLDIDNTQELIATIK
ncbi:FkbM family methyltransferase [Candidatus Dependentiae bacterium]|nr:FkbM family methyltransferase [Candidatus Dependentiae bacterium]